MLNHQNLILVAISIVSLTSIYLLYTNYQKMQDVAMIREEIVLLKSSLSKMNTYENEIFLKINERLKQLEDGLVSGQVPRTVNSVEQPNNNELTEENIELLNQNYQNEENVVEVSTEGLEPLGLDSEEIQELNDLQNQVDEVDNIINDDEMRNMNDNENSDVILNRVNNLEVTEPVELEDIELEELNSSEIDNEEVNANLNLSNEENLEVNSNININLKNLITTNEREQSVEEPVEELVEELVEEPVEELVEELEEQPSDQTKSPLDSFLIENSVDNLDDDLADDLDLDDLDDLNENENPITTPSDLSENYLNGLTVKELKVISKQKGLKTRGNKKELINIILKNR